MSTLPVQSATHLSSSILPVLPHTRIVSRILIPQYFSRSFPQTQVIPFMQHLIVGLDAAARAFQLANKLPDNMSVDDVAKEKGFSFTPSEIKLQYARTSLEGHG